MQHKYPKILLFSTSEILGITNCFSSLFQLFSRAGARRNSAGNEVDSHDQSPDPNSAPLIRHVDDDATTWRDMWNLQTSLVAIPYYMFIEWDTEASHYFPVPLAMAHKIFSSAYAGLADTARTFRDPSMSASPWKVDVVGEEAVAGKRVFVLKFFQALDPIWVVGCFVRNMIRPRSGLMIWGQLLERRSFLREGLLEHCCSYWRKTVETVPKEDGWSWLTKA